MIKKIKSDGGVSMRVAIALFVSVIFISGAAFAATNYINAIGQNISIGNANEIFIDNTNSRIGFGTTGPGILGTAQHRFLTMTSSGNNASIIELQMGTATSAGNTLGEIDIYNGVTRVAALGGFGGGATDSGYLGFYTKSTGGSLSSRMTIDTTGNVGIGTSSPTAKFDISGTNVVNNLSLSVNNTLYVNGSTDYVGIGTANPRDKVEIVGGLVIRRPSTTQTSWLTDVGGLLVSSQNEIDFVTGTAATVGTLDLASIRLVITSTGLVGIGTLTPNYMLEVNGTVNITGGLNVTTGGLNVISGNVGIGTTTPNQALQVIGNINASGVVYAANFSSNSPLQLQTAGTTRVFINDSNGNVGIGTSTPTAMLDVQNNGPGVVAQFRDIEAGGEGIYVYANTASAYLATEIGAQNGVRITPASDVSFVLNNEAIGEVNIWGFQGVLGYKAGNTVNGTTGTFSGNVGIGTLLPVGKLHINSSLGAGALRIENTTGSSLLFVNGTSGNVGIGITNPSRNLHVKAATTTMIASETSGADSSPQFTLTNDVAQWSLKLDGANSDALTFRDDNFGERMVLTTEGNLGIGTTSPAQLLTLKGAVNNTMLNVSDGSRMFGIYAGRLSGATNDNGISLGTNTETPLRIYTNNTDRISIGTSGNVGIGTTVPVALLHLNSSSAMGTLRVENTTGASLLFVNGTSGYVGIGTTGPLASLHISGGYNTTPAFSNTAQLRITGTGAAGTGNDAVIRFSTPSNSRLIYLDESDTNKLKFTGGGATDLVTIDNVGNVGIGTTSPPAKLDVSDSIALASAQIDGEILRIVNTRNQTTSPVAMTFNAVRNDEDNDTLYWVGELKVNSSRGAGIGAYPSSSMAFHTADGAGNVLERMRIGSNGFVGIGTAAPTAGGLSDGNPVMHLKGSGGGVIVLERTSATTGRWEIGPNSEGNLYVISNLDSNAGVFLARAATSWSAASDERLKNIYGNIENGLEKISTLRNVYYKFKNEDNNTARMRVGVIAQDVQAVLPEAVDQSNNGDLSVRYTDLIPLLIGGVQELNNKTETLNTQNNLDISKLITENSRLRNQSVNQQKQIDELKSRLNSLETKIK